jgi:hypothetical protein
VIAAYIGVTAIKLSRRRALEAQAATHETKVAAGLAPASPGGQATPPPEAPAGGQPSHSKT